MNNLLFLAFTGLYFKLALCCFQMEIRITRPKNSTASYWNCSPSNRSKHSSLCIQCFGKSVIRTCVDLYYILCIAKLFTGKQRTLFDGKKFSIVMTYLTETACYSLQIGKSKSLYISVKTEKCFRNLLNFLFLLNVLFSKYVWQPCWSSTFAAKEQ